MAMQNIENGLKLLFRWVSKRGWAFCFIIVFLGGAYLRLRALTLQSYWDDELFSAAISDPNNTLRQVVRLTVSDVHPPLFQVLLWYWFKIFGFSEMTGRLFPAIFGILSIPVMFLLGREAGDRKIGFSCALICAINIFHLHYSQEVRSYSFLFFLSALSLWLFFRVIQRPGRGNLIAYIAAATAMAYTHFFGLFILLAQAVFFLLARMAAGIEFKRAGIVIGIVLSITLFPLVPIIVKNGGIAAFWIKPPSPDFAITYFQEYFGSSLIAIGAALALLLGVIRYSRTLEKNDVVRVLIFCITIVLMLPYVRSLMGVPMLTCRNTIVALPAIFALVAIGFGQIHDKIPQALALFVFVVLSLLLIFYQPPYYHTVTKPQIREAARALIASNPDPEMIYAPEEVVRNFNVYFLWLKVPLRVQSLDKLYKNYGEDKLPIRFWVIDGRVGPLFDQIMRDPKVHVIQKTEFFLSGVALMELTK